jgi:hypothetical protein
MSHLRATPSRHSVVTALSLCVTAMLTAAGPAYAQHQEKSHPSYSNKQNPGDLVRREDNFRRRDYHHEGHRMRLQDGRWHHWYEGRFRLAPPPLGFWLPALPSIHRVWRNAGATYYIVDNAWFRPLDNGGYIAIAAPIDPPVAVMPTPSPPPPLPHPAYRSFVDELYAYPKGTQTAARTQTDKQECAQWAGGQVLADPWAIPYTDTQKGNYVRAFSACMEARNYVVR